MSESTTGGTYTLVLAVPDSATIEVGALGPREFEAGQYAYTGSALGPGGFARVERHRELCAGERDARHWHVDYLLGHDDVTVETVVRTPERDVECTVSRALAETATRIPDFGASDCDCPSHLVFDGGRGSLGETVERAHERARSTD